jgi:hypothetical protein
MVTDITTGMPAILAVISPLVIGVTLIDVTLIALNILLAVALIRRTADSWRILHNCLGHVERPRQWADHVDAGLPTRFLDDWSTCGTGSISGSRMTGSVSRT